MRQVLLALVIIGCGAENRPDSADTLQPERAASPELGAAVAAELTQYETGTVSTARQRLATADLRALYADETDRLVWFNNEAPRPVLDSVLTTLDGAGRHGLDPARYGGEKLRVLRHQVDSGRVVSPERLASLDVAASVAALELLRALGLGQVDPRSQGFGFDPPGRGRDYAALVAQARDAGSFRAVIDSLLPSLPEYNRLVGALARYRRLAEAEASWPKLAALPPSGRVTMGDDWSGVPALRVRLVATGDRPADSSRGTVYDSLTAQAMRRFQARHGLSADGVIGVGTIAALVVPMAQRVEQLTLALERLRWFPALPPARVVVVNLPFYELDAFEEIRRPPKFSMRVVIGERGIHATPIFADSIAELVFRPYWNIPATLAAREIVDSAKSDSTFMAAHEYEIIRNYSDSAVAIATSPERLDSVRVGTLFMRQRPGPLNSLGRVKFLFPNKDDIYLHDSPARSLFARERRAFSHGCVRVDQPLDLAAWLLADQPTWTRAKITAAMVAAKPSSARLRRKVPVVLYYSTAKVDPDGTVRFAGDPYGLDEELRRALDGAD